ncbi:flagellar protein FlgN [Metabacillus sp. GX 13764]|uniref:flagellar protein FlgN n=1 Tax=Metabacillus kandeliae TaxID=2900151 RepID=UPI001E50C950|nr:flagellar protein FlgN [Metabacillus kandeliae]MCD7034450.1 flagellar protein FlgN [Metabacillus kandeliae]
MPAEKLISSLERLLQLNTELYEMALEKTDLLKKDRADDLKNLLLREQAAVRSIQEAEAGRIQYAAEFLQREHDLTLTDCINKAKGAEKVKLTSLLGEFTDVMSKLKTANQLNHQLSQQALQFVRMTMDMLLPREQTPNYSRPTVQKETEPKRRSLFDSKA